MKNTITLLAALLISISSFAQGSGINYKAVIKDDSGNILANQNLKVKFSILDSFDNPDYSETHTTTTDANGIVILIIGSGTENITGNYFDINWGDDLYKLKVEIDPEPYGVFVNMGTSTFQAVPYAKQAESATFRTVNNITSNSPGDLVNDNFVFGSSQMDDNTAISEDNSRMFFNKAKSAFRAGSSENKVIWDNVSVGIGSTAFGIDNTASGLRSTALGWGTQATGENATTMGRNTFATADNSLAIGWLNVDEPDALFMVGNGFFDGGFNQSNALTVFNDGTITAPSFDISEITDAKALITKEYLEANVSVSTGLEAINEGNGRGWRIIGRNPDFYGAIGLNAIDLSFSSNESNSGALGQNSIALGNETTAFGFYSTAMGSTTTAYGFGSLAMGYNTMASGNRSIAMGVFTKAESYNTLAIGSYNIGGGDPLSPIPTNSLFEIGNGNSESERNNALTILKNGDAKFDGKVQHTTTGSANMIPIAYGTINSAGTVLSGTGNFSVKIEPAAPTTYLIDVTSETLSHTNSSTLVTPLAGVFRTASITHLNGDVRVYIFNSIGTQVTNTFQFVIYRL